MRLDRRSRPVGELHDAIGTCARVCVFRLDIDAARTRGAASERAGKRPVHFHLLVLVLDGVYRREGDGRLRFVPVPAPTAAELNRLVQRIAERIGRSLERSGLITRDIENAPLFEMP
jgi:hypothetical protein